MICRTYDLIHLWYVASIICYIYGLSHLWSVASIICYIYDLSHLWSGASMTCHIYKLPQLWSSMSMIFMSMMHISSIISIYLYAAHSKHTYAVLRLTLSTGHSNIPIIYTYTLLGKCTLHPEECTLHKATHIYFSWWTAHCPQIYTYTSLWVECALL